MTLKPIIREGILPGALAGLAGGIISAAALSQIGALPGTASLVRAGAPSGAYAAYGGVAALLGAAFGVLVWHQRTGAGETLFWGLTYGALLWFLGPLTLMPWLLIGTLAWDVHSAQEAFAALPGNLLYGVATGLTLAAVRRPAGRVAVRLGHLARGVMAGFGAAWILRALLTAQDVRAVAAALETTAEGVGPAIWSAGLVMGAGYALLYLHPPPGTGPGLIRGTVYGFLGWVAAPLTVLPLLHGRPLAWSLDAAREGFLVLPGFLIAGAVLAVVYQWVDGGARLLFSDLIAEHDEEGLGARGLHALGHGALAGVAGGALYLIVLARAGGLTAVAGLVRSESAGVGLMVHLIIAALLGAAYGVLFRRQSYDVASGLGWGISYGFFWWILGPLTLMPLLEGMPLGWTVEVAGRQFPNLIGHLAYGAGLGVVFHALEARLNPWWIPRSRAEAARVSRRKEQVLTSAPALWALVATIALALPVLLGF